MDLVTSKEDKISELGVELVTGMEEVFSGGGGKTFEELSVGKEVELMIQKILFDSTM